MTAAEWKEKIVLSCKDAGTYRNCFEDVIDTLSDILETRDKAMQQYKNAGSEPIIEYTNKGGATNLVRSPYLATVDELNKTALTYWRDLGLTPKGLKAIDESAVKAKKTSGLQEVLKMIE